MDTDLISLRPLDKSRNFVVWDYENVNNDFMHFEQEHEFLNAYLEDMSKVSRTIMVDPNIKVIKTLELVFIYSTI